MKNYEFRVIFKPDAFLIGVTYIPSEKDWHEINLYIPFVVFHLKIFV
tara:strand:- start:530 stop:670 length:141 start_codon:yes stop_codon:yes gene_type:complete